jgi:CheY-like chemotaxis protein
VALKGSLGLELARRFLPTAVSLDIFLPDMLGWTVLNQLKLDPATRHIPVQIFSVAEEDRNHGLAHGAFSYVVKSSTSEEMEAALDRIRDFTVPRTRRLLVIEDNDCATRSSTASFSTCGCPTSVASSCWSNCMPTRRSPRCRWSSSRARTSPSPNRSSCARWPRASC